MRVFDEAISRLHGSFVRRFEQTAIVVHLTIIHSEAAVVEKERKYQGESGYERVFERGNKDKRAFKFRIPCLLKIR